VYINNIIELSLKSKLTRLRYKKKFLNSDLHKIEDIKHITKAVARLTYSRLGKRAIIKLV
jgi:ribosomal protein L29